MDQTKTITNNEKEQKLCGGFDTTNLLKLKIPFTAFL